MTIEPGEGIERDHVSAARSPEEELVEEAQSRGHKWKVGGSAIHLASGAVSTPKKAADVCARDVHEFEEVSRARVALLPMADLIEERDALSDKVLRMQTELTDYREKVSSKSNSLSDVDRKEAEASAEDILAEILENTPGGGDWLISDNPLFARAQEIYDKLSSVVKTNEISEALRARDGVKVEGFDKSILLECELNKLLVYEILHAQRIQDSLAGEPAGYTYSECFLNAEDNEKAMAMFQDFDQLMEKMHDILAKSPEEIAAEMVGDLEGIPRFKERLYKMFFIDKKTGERFNPTNIARPENIEKWFKDVLIPAANKTYSGDSLVTPIDRRNAAVYALFEKLEVAYHFRELIRTKNMVLDGGDKVILGMGQTYNLKNGSSVKISPSGKVTLTIPAQRKRTWGEFFRRADAPSHVLDLSPGQEGDLGNGVIIKLPKGKGARPILTFTEPSQESYKVHEKPILVEKRDGSGRLQLLYRFNDGTEVSKEAWESNPSEIDRIYVKDQLLGVQRYAHRHELVIREQCSWSDIRDTRQLVEKNQAFQMKQHEMTLTRKEEVRVEVKRLMEQHCLKAVGLSPAEKEKLHTLLSNALIRKYEIADKDGNSYITKSKIQEALSAMKDKIFERKDNQRKIRDLTEALSDLETQYREMPAGDRTDAYENEYLSKKAKIEEGIIWYQKDSVIALMQRVIDAVGVHSDLTEAHRLPDSDEQKSELMEIYGHLKGRLGELTDLKNEKERERIQAEKNFESSTNGSATIIIVKELAKDAMHHFTKSYSMQPGVEELDRRLYLSSIGYDMSRELKSVLQSIFTGKAEGCDPHKPFKENLKTQAQEFLKALHEEPELGALIVSDIDQIRNLLAGSSFLTTLESRLKAHTLTKAFLEGVPEEREKKADPAKVRKLQALADVLRIAVYATGGIDGSVNDNWVRALTQKIPVVGDGLSYITGAMYGLAKTDLIRSTVTNMDGEVRELAFSVANAIEERSPAGFVKAQAMLDGARSLGEMAKVLDDDGNIIKNGVKRAGRAIKGWFVNKFGAMAKLFKTSNSVVDKIAAVFGFVAPIAGVILGGLALGGILAVGIFLPVGIALIGAMFGISAYARTKSVVANYLKKFTSSEAQDMKKRFEKIPDSNPEKKKLKDELMKDAEKRVLEAQKYGYYDSALREHVAAFNKQNAAKKKKIIDTYVASDLKAFEEYKLQRRDCEDQEKLKAEFHQRYLIREKFKVIIHEVYESLLEGSTRKILQQRASSDGEVADEIRKDRDYLKEELFSISAKKEASSTSSPFREEEFKETVKELDRTPVSLEHFRFSAALAA